MSVKSSIGALRLSTKTIHTFPLLLIVKYHLACLDILLLANDVTRLHIKLERENNENSNKAFVLEKLLFPSSEKNTADSKTGNDCAASIRFSPDSLKGYWVSPVKMIPKLPGITRHSTYYSTTEKVLYRMVQDDG